MALTAISSHHLVGAVAVSLVPTTLGDNGPEILARRRIGDERISLDARICDISLEKNRGHRLHIDLNGIAGDFKIAVVSASADHDSVFPGVDDSVVPYLDSIVFQAVDVEAICGIGGEVVVEGHLAHGPPAVSDLITVHCVIPHICNRRRDSDRRTLPSAPSTHRDVFNDVAGVQVGRLGGHGENPDGKSLVDLSRGMTHVDSVDPVASLVGTQVNRIKIKGPDSLLLGRRLQLRVVIVNAEVRDFDAGSRIIVGAEHHPSSRIPGHAGRVGEEADQLQDGFVDAGAVDLPILIKRESSRSLMGHVDDKVVSPFGLECAWTDADDQVLLIGL